MIDFDTRFQRIGASAVVPIASALVLVWAAPAQAACTPTGGGNVASIVQDASSSHGLATITQTLSVSGSACINQGGSNASAYLRQEGGGAGSNIAEITQIGGIGQGAYVRQQGSDNRATVTQSQANGATSLGTQSLLTPGTLSVVANAHMTGSAAILFQSGSSNTATIEQRAGADGSYAEINQGTDLSTAAITQDDTLTAAVAGNFASIIQKFSGSTGDTATVTQNGDDNYAALAQNGSNLTGSINQTYDGNTAALTQTGSNLSYAIAQNGVSTSVSANGAAPIVLTTSGGANSISVSVSQTSSGASITVN